jgi:N-acetylneuraminic acid mutarotase
MVPRAVKRPSALALLLVAAAVAAPGWEPLAPLPDPLGVAGPFAGVTNGALLVAGGANFPRGYPWAGGAKVWHDTVWVLPTPGGLWRVGGVLPRPLGYGVAVTTPAGVLCVGGSDAQRHWADCFRLTWANDRLSVDPLPALPRALASLCGALVGATLYVAGGSATPDAVETSRACWSLDTSRPGAGWQELPPCPGGGRMLAVAAGLASGFCLAGGVDLSAGPDGKPVRRYLRDAWCYQPAGGWRRLADLPWPVCAAPSPGPVVSPTRFLVLGGDDGSKLGFQPVQAHPGFNRRVLCYDAAAGRWTEQGELPAAQVTTTMVVWDGRIVVPSGEVRPGVRSAQVWTSRLADHQSN